MSKITIDEFRTEYEWPFNFLAAVHDEMIDINNQPRDIVGSVEYVVGELSSNARKIVNLIFREGEAQADVAREFGVSRPESHNKIQSALCEARKPRLMRYLRYGVAALTSLQLGNLKWSAKLRLPVDILDIQNTYAANSLRRNNIMTIGEFVRIISIGDPLKQIHGFGKKALVDTMNALSDIGMTEQLIRDYIEKKRQAKGNE